MSPDFSTPTARSISLELPTSHRVPVSWLRHHASPSIKLRTVRDVLPPGSATPEDQAALLQEVQSSKPVQQPLKKQKVNGTWGDNILGLDPSRGRVLPGLGTVTQYRRLLELGLPPHERPFRLADRILFRLLSRDESPELLFEFRGSAKGQPEFATWVRTVMREAATAALAHAGHVEDPRVRGAAHRIVSDVSQFLRSELAEKPFVRRGARTVLHPGAYPPTVFSVGMLALMPNLQRERAGFLDRLATYLARPGTKRPYVLQLGKKAVKPTVELLGDPLEADSAGRPKDLPFALVWIEILVRLGVLATSPTASRVLARLLKECDERGVWSPKSLRSLPRSPSNLASYAFPLEPDTKTPERRQADVTFRLALIAKLAGWKLEYT